MISNAIPLADVLPWGDVVPTSGRTILVQDSAGTDGRFLLHTLAMQTLARRPYADRSGGGSADARNNRTIQNVSAGGGGRVLWLGCTPATDAQIASAMKKIGCDVSVTAAAVLRATGAAGSSSITRPTTPRKRLEIIPIMHEIASFIVDNGREEKGEGDEIGIDHEYLKKLHGRVKSWLLSQEQQQQKQQQQQQQQGTTSSSVDQRHLVVIDDASSLATIFGSRATEMFIRQVRALLRRDDGGRRCCLAILCSADADQDRYLTDVASKAQGGGGTVNVTGGGRKGPWIGSAGDTSLEEDAVSALTCPWERSLVELADGIVDVVPLQSGFSLEAHGRLVFTERKGGLGWKERRKETVASSRGGVGAEISTSSSSVAFFTAVVNYCCEESSVKAFRLRSTS